MDLIAVAAIAENRAIGRDGEIPWESIPADRRQYRERIAGEPVILGRRTFESMLDALPGRVQIVLSRSRRSFDVASAHHAGTVKEAIALAEAHGDDVAYVIGGGEIYDRFMPYLDRMIISRVPGEYEADTFYPAWDDTVWTLEEETAEEGYTIEVWTRRSPPERP